MAAFSLINGFNVRLYPTFARSLLLLFTLSPLASTWPEAPLLPLLPLLLPPYGGLLPLASVRLRAEGAEGAEGAEEAKGQSHLLPAALHSQKQGKQR